MSEFHVQCVRLGAVEKHHNADSLSVTQVHGGYPVVFRTGDFAEGGLAVYVPIDAVVPQDDPRFAFLGARTRIRAAKLRGIFSMGLLVAADSDMVEGEDVRERLRIEKFVPLAERETPLSAGHLGGPTDNESDPNFMPAYTDLEGLRKFPDALRVGEQVVVTEKVHGCNSRFVFRDGRLWVGSHHRIKKTDSTNVWTKVAAQLGLAEKLSAFDSFALFGEVYGDVQDLRYGCAAGELGFVAFDVFDGRRGRWLEYDDFRAMAAHLEVACAPQLYRGPWDEALRELRNGDSVLAASRGVKQIREGIVIRTVPERFDPQYGRGTLKLVGEQYLLRKEAA